MEIPPNTLASAKTRTSQRHSRPFELPEGAEPGGEAGRRVRVLVVDDQEIVRRGLSMRLEIEPDLEVVGEAADGRVAALVTALRPDVVLMDLLMPMIDGIEAAALLARVAPGTAVVMLSLYDDAKTRGRASAAGASGFVAKHQPERELVEEIRRAARLYGDGR